MTIIAPRSGPSTFRKTVAQISVIWLTIHNSSIFDIERPDHFAMHAQEFGDLLNDVVTHPLEADGFQKHGKCLFRGDTNCQFA